jgi:GT2 family glycosyltransferase
MNRPVWPQLEALAEHARQQEKHLGMITGRDGYEWGYQQFAGSFWSESALHERLPHGVWRERPCMNTGPLIYPKEVVKTIGLQDEEFVAYYAWDDYALRAKAAGFTNFVLGMDLIHAKFGRVTSTWWAVTGDNAAHDMARVKRKHGLP